ncbi:MAG: hypothetical protein ABFC78_06840 [Methanoregula sp.]
MHGGVVRSVRRGRRSAAAVRDMPVTLGHVRLHGLIARSAHITSLFSGVARLVG